MRLFSNETITDDEYCPRSTEILKRLRALMKDSDRVPEPLDAYIVHSQDAHQASTLHVSKRFLQHEPIFTFLP